MSSGADTHAVFTVDFVSSKDGTKIGYRKYDGASGNSHHAIVLINGAVGTTYTYHSLASRLAAAHFDVYVPERRGRPLSPCRYSPAHTIARDVEDVQAIITRTGARSLFGLSSGAVIALEAARTLPAGTLDKVVSFEAPLYAPPERMRFDLVQRYFDHIRAGHLVAAMLYALLASGLAPAFLYHTPSLLIVPLLAAYLRIDAWLKGSATPAAAQRYHPMRDLVPSMQFDFGAVRAMQDSIDAFRSITADVLLLSCSKSPSYMRTSAAYLDKQIQTATWIELQGLDHGAPWNDGRPDVVSAEIIKFFENAAV